jgi:hypothetical protein
MGEQSLMVCFLSGSGERPQNVATGAGLIAIRSDRKRRNRRIAGTIFNSTHYIICCCWKLTSLFVVVIIWEGTIDESRPETMLDELSFSRSQCSEIPKIRARPFEKLALLLPTTRKYKSMDRVPSSYQ